MLNSTSPEVQTFTCSQKTPKGTNFWLDGETRPAPLFKLPGRRIRAKRSPVIPCGPRRPAYTKDDALKHGVCWLFIFKVTEPSSIPYRTHSACAKRAAYPDPPPVIPLPDTGVAGSHTSPVRGLLVNQDRTD